MKSIVYLVGIYMQGIEDSRIYLEIRRSFNEEFI